MLRFTALPRGATMVSSPDLPPPVRRGRTLARSRPCVGACISAVACPLSPPAARPGTTLLTLRNLPSTSAPAGGCTPEKASIYFVTMCSMCHVGSIGSGMGMAATQDAPHPATDQFATVEFICEAAADATKGCEQRENGCVCVRCVRRTGLQVCAAI